MSLEILSEERIEEPRLRVVPQEPRTVVKRVMPDAEMLRVLTALSNILVVRLMLLAAVIFAGVLAFLAMPHPEPNAIWLLGVFSVLVLGPLVWLAQRRT